MPKISNLPSVINLDLNDVFAVVSKDNDNNDTTMKAAVSAVANKLNNDISYPALNTSNNSIVGSINEVYGTRLTATLTTGSTSVTISDASITTSSLIDLYTDVYGLSPDTVTVTTGQIVLTFEAQASDVSIKVRVS